MVFKVIKSRVDIHNKRFFEIISPPSVLSTACRRINSSVALCNTFYEEERERERERERKKRKKERKKMDSLWSFCEWCMTYNPRHAEKGSVWHLKWNIKLKLLKITITLLSKSVILITQNHFNTSITIENLKIYVVIS